MPYGLAGSNLVVGTLALKSVFKKILGPFAWQNLLEIKSNIFPLDKNSKKLLDLSVSTLEKANFYAKFLPTNSLCFDVGAHIGNKTQALLLAQAKVVAIEPQEKLVKKLRKRFIKDVTIVNKGISDKIDKKDFYISDATTLSTFSKEWTVKMKDSRFKIYHWKKNKNQIDTTTLDELITKYGIPFFIKIDVEGHEIEVLKGLSQIIPIVSFEFAIPEFYENLVTCLSILNQLNSNYQFNYINGEQNEFNLPNNLNYNEFIEHIKSDSFNKIGFGDIYAFE